MPEEFACRTCGSPSVVYTDAGEDDGHVVCRRCGAFLMTRGQFRRFVDTRALRSDNHLPRPENAAPAAALMLHTSGC